MSLLDAALKAPTKAANKRSASTDELELAVAWFHGRVSSQQAAKALEMGKSIGVSSWAVRVLQISLADARCSLVITDPEEDAADAAHEKAAASLSTLGRTAQR